MLFKCFFWSWFAWVCPGLHFNFWVIWKLELPIGLNTTNILQGQGDLPWLWPILDWYFPEVPGENSQISNQIIKALIRLVWVIEDLLAPRWRWSSEWTWRSLPRLTWDYSSYLGHPCCSDHMQTMMNPTYQRHFYTHLCLLNYFMIF